MPNTNIDKIAWELVVFAKETAKKNIVAAVSSGQIKVDPEVLPVIIMLIDSSINEGFNKGHKNFIKKVSLTSETGDATVVLKKRK